MSVSYFILDCIFGQKSFVFVMFKTVLSKKKKMEPPHIHVVIIEMCRAIKKKKS